MHIAMWSGPRNLSTALMYAFAARGDCAVADEPFYAAYLARTGRDHPMRDEILASQATAPDEVVKVLTGPISGGMPHHYQKHMTQHMTPEVPRTWLGDVTNVFLVRHPARVVASFARKYENPAFADIGFRQQAELFDHVSRLGQTPVVIDSADIRANPERALSSLCAAIGLDWKPAMLSWPAGGHPDEGVWAAHWYGEVHQSTGFAGPEGPLPRLSGRYAALVEQAMPYYDRLRSEALTLQ